MKGEYFEQQKNENPTMFSKLHTHPSHPHHHQQQQHQQQQPSPHYFPVTLQECKTPEDDSNSRSSGGTAAAATATPTTTTTTPAAPTSTPKTAKTNEGHSGDGATIEVVRRPRGRPPGSKNKPKPPVIITRDTEPPMSPYILEVQGGKDIVEAITRFCRRKNTGICVLSGSGTVANVTLKQPSTTPGATVTFHGRFDILSISATFLAPTSSCVMPNGLTISLAGPQGQIVGGLVAGQLIAAGTVYLVAASFNNPSFHRLNGDDHEGQGHTSVSGGGGDVQSPPISGGGDGGGEMSMYSCHMPSDVIWAPNARQPQPPPY